MTAQTSWRRLLIASLALFVSVVAFGLATAPDDQPADSTRGAPNAEYSHEQLQGAANMTQAMSTVNAGGRMQSGQMADDQLRQSHNPGFVDALEQHQAEVNRMLGLGTDP